MSLEAMAIDLRKKTALIDACKVTINVNAKQRGQFLARKLLISQDSVIPPHSKAMIFLVKLPLPNNRDFLFHPTPQANLTLDSYIMDYETLKLFVSNGSNLPPRVP